MKYLLDTHVLLWWLNDDQRMGRVTRAAIADPSNDVFVSVASLWELTIKQRIGKITADVAHVASGLPNFGFTMLGVTVEHLSALRDLPSHHRDPFDLLLITQAITEDATFVSEDQVIGRYPVRLIRLSG